MISEYNENFTMTMLNFTTPIPGGGGSGGGGCPPVGIQLEGVILPPASSSLDWWNKKVH